MQILTATIFGLNSETSEVLKRAIEITLPQNLVLEWTTISAKPVDLVFLNHYFLHSDAIQNYFKRYPKTQYLCLEHNLELAGKILDNQLYYPFKDSSDLKAWWQLKFLDIRTPCVIGSNFYHQIAEMLLARNSFLRMHQQGEDLAIIDTRTERIFLHPDLYIQQFFSPDIEQSYAKSSRVNAVQGYFSVADLKIWLWNMLYPARHQLQTQSIAVHSCYRLLQWPQFTADLERKHFLKMAAFFAHGAQVEYVAQKTSCSIQQVKAFIYLTQLLNMSEKIQDMEARFLTQDVEVESASAVGVFQGLFGKLRRKLGI